VQVLTAKRIPARTEQRVSAWVRPPTAVIGELGIPDFNGVHGFENVRWNRVVITNRMRDSRNAAGAADLIAPCKDVAIVEPGIDAESQHVISAKAALVSRDHHAIRYCAAGGDQFCKAVFTHAFKMVRHQNRIKPSVARDRAELQRT